jgi:hypothetical protein
MTAYIMKPKGDIIWSAQSGEGNENLWLLKDFFFLLFYHVHLGSICIWNTGFYQQVCVKVCSWLRHLLLVGMFGVDCPDSLIWHLMSGLVLHWNFLYCVPSVTWLHGNPEDKRCFLSQLAQGHSKNWKHCDYSVGVIAIEDGAGLSRKKEA